MIRRFQNSTLGQQLAIVTAGLCLLVSLALIALAAISSHHTQVQLQEQYGSTLARQVAQRVSTAMERGDLLSVLASLQRFTDISAADTVTITDVEGKTLGQAGDSGLPARYVYTAPIEIDSHTAGQVRITMSGDNMHSLQWRLVLSLLALAVLLSFAVYMGSARLGQVLGQRLSGLARAISLEGEQLGRTAINEVDRLEKQIRALPMDLLRTRSEPNPQEENYRNTAVLYLQLDSLVNYVDTLDEDSLQRYTDQLHQVAFAAAGFYAGELQVTRQFALAIFFSGPNSAGSAAFRAASCGWLIHAVCRELEKQMSLSMGISMAVAESELGMGDGSDIYPGLYMQHTIDELQSVCAARPPHILLSPRVCEDVDIASRLQHHPTEVQDYAQLDAFAGNFEDLLERQLRLMMKRLSDPGRRIQV